MENNQSAFAAIAEESSTSRASFTNCIQECTSPTGLDYNSDSVPCEDDDNKGVFYFESDRLALKGNLDYCNLIKSVSLLEAQRIKLLKDIESLYDFKVKVKENPLFYTEKILSGDTSDIPSQIILEEVPKIDWSKYDLISTREKHQLRVTDLQPTKKDDDQHGVRIRGRVYDTTKPQTFNQLWTADEQLRLEELLVQFPPERIEYNRFRKIADALGNRTPKQVCSRVQKYFLKLQKAGIAIPGHPIKSSTKKSTKSGKNFYHKNSTFFPTLQLGDMPISDSDQEDEQQEDENEILNDQMKIEILMKVKEHKEKEENRQPFFHDGISCTLCGEDPLEGTRWQCLDCQDLNMCSDCVVSQLDLEVPEHPPSHKLEPLGDPACASWDPDYMSCSFGTNNYLDPNYMPV